MPKRWEIYPDPADPQGAANEHREGGGVENNLIGGCQNLGSSDMVLTGFALNRGNG